jgi:hypothetical protein
MFSLKTPTKIVILRACDLFDFFRFLLIQPAVFQTPNKAVILSEALRKSIANRGFIARSRRTPTALILRILLDPFRPSTPENRIFRQYALDE